ncbi:MAG: hypothetical protein JW976_13990 [Syntrophaceae bacterium]|nr:hypothetical protein [Syntrophaceae bacterium]
MIKDRERFQKHIRHLFRRMTEIYDSIYDQWIIDQMQNNKALLDKIVDILGEIDPQGLVCCGAPEDEYEPEAETILLRQSEWKTIDALEKIIAEEFAWWFFLYDENDKVKHYGAPEYKVIARQIWNARLEEKGKKPIAFKDRIILSPKRPMIVIEID